MQQRIPRSGRATLLPVVSALLVANVALGAAEPEKAGEARIRASVARLVAPAELAANELVEGGEGPLDGETCVKGLSYWPAGSKPGLAVLSTSGTYLGEQRLRRGFDEVTRGGKAPAAEMVFSLACQDAAFTLIRNVGIVRLAGFDRASLCVGDIGQDECGDATAVVLAVRGPSYVFLTLPLRSLTSSWFTCPDHAPGGEEDCKQRIACIRGYLGKQANRDALVRKLGEVTAGLSFAPAGTPAATR